MPEPAVDELRRRARRRLVGAVVLALAAAVLLPLLLESEPKPLGDDVSIQIPPVDTGKFINPLSSAKAPDPKLKGSTVGAGSSAAPSQSSPPGAPTPPPQNTGASGTPAAGAPSAMPAPPSSTGDAKNGATQSSSAPAPAVAKGDSARDASASDRTTAAATAKADAAGTGSGYVIQLAAFSDHYGANSLASRLKRSGFPGYTEAVTTDKGATLHRVRVGPYASREAADAALAKLKAAGFSGMVTHVG